MMRFFATTTIFCLLLASTGASAAMPGYALDQYIGMKKAYIYVPTGTNLVDVHLTLRATLVSGPVQNHGCSFGGGELSCGELGSNPVGLYKETSAVKVYVVRLANWTGESVLMTQIAGNDQEEVEISAAYASWPFGECVLELPKDDDRCMARCIDLGYAAGSALEVQQGFGCMWVRCDCIAWPGGGNGLEDIDPCTPQPECTQCWFPPCN